MQQASNFPEQITQDLLLQDFLAYDQRGWVTVYCSRHPGEDYGIFSFFASRSSKRAVLSRPEWGEINAYCGHPGFVEDSVGRYRYARFGRRDGLIPLVVRQDHSGVLPTMLPQLLEEFRLFHNLWVNPDGTEHRKLMPDGTDEIACEVKQNSVRIRSKYLRQFQAARQLCFVRCLDSIIHVNNQWSGKNLKSLDYLESSSNSIIRRDVRVGLVGVNDVSSRILAKHTVNPPPRNECGVWPWEQDTEAHLEHQRFIVGETDTGEPIEHTCDLDLMRENLGCSDDLPLGQLTPVCFRKEVMDRYYADQQKYQVADGHVSCGGCWSLAIDNNHPDYITVFLYRLGLELPKQEQLHWRLHNMAPPGHHLSSTAYRRNILGEWADPDSPEWRFKQQYRAFQSTCSEALGWDLLLETSEGGVNPLDRVRVPPRGSEQEFDEQVLLLNKLVVEALNVEQMRKALGDKSDGLRGPLSLLKAWFTDGAYVHTARDIDTLNKIKTIRNKTAHRKGTSYATTLEKLSIPKDRQRAVALLLMEVEGMFSDWTTFLA